jgi:hypothetical protein
VTVSPGVVIRSPVQEIGAAEVPVARRRGGRPSQVACSGLAGRLCPGRFPPRRVTAAPPATLGRLAGRRPLTTAGTAVGVKVTRPAGLLTGGSGPLAPPGLVRPARGGRRVTAAARAWVRVLFLTRRYPARRGGPGVTGPFAWGGGTSVTGGPIARYTGTSVTARRLTWPAGR